MPIPQISRTWLFACLVAGVTACAQTPKATPAPPPAAPATDAEGKSPPPKLRSIKPAELPREEPGVGVGGLTHEAEQPAK